MKTEKSYLKSFSRAFYCIVDFCNQFNIFVVKIIRGIDQCGIRLILPFVSSVDGEIILIYTSGLVTD